MKQPQNKKTPAIKAGRHRLASGDNQRHRANMILKN
jgi:hypothetical protein